MKLGGTLSDLPLLDFSTQPLLIYSVADSIAREGLPTRDHVELHAFIELASRAARDCKGAKQDPTVC
jgi:hypothetical protein